jgi:hypothetical protein
LTFPLLNRYAEKIGAEFRVISERKFPDWPITFEKFQIFNLGREAENDWNIYIDADALIHPETPDFTLYIPKDTIAHTGQDFAPLRWKYDRFYMRDGRDIGSCFPAGTILPGSGSIEALEIGSSVLTKNGFQKVTNTFQRNYTGKLISLKIACLPELRVTAEHPILVSTSQFRYHSGKRPTTGVHKCRERVFSEPIWKKAEDVNEMDWVVIPRSIKEQHGRLKFRTQGSKIKHGKRRFVDVSLDEDLAWLLGLYVAEGYISENNRLNLIISVNEKYLADRAIEIFHRIGLTARIGKPTKSTLSIVVSCSGIARLFDQWCGHGAAKKRIPPEIIQSPANIARSFLTGLVEGDGCVFYNKRGGSGFRLVTVSRQLVFDVVYLLHKLGIHAHAGNPRRNSEIIEGRKVNAQVVYEINWSFNSWFGELDKQGSMPKGHGCFTENEVFLPIRKTSTVVVKNLQVHNIETEDSTYLVPFIVHNCNWFTIASDWCIELWEPCPDLTPQEAIDSCFPTIGEVKSGVITPYHLIDDFLIGRNIAKYGLKFVKMHDIVAQKCPGSWFFWHAYTIPPEQKASEMKAVLSQWKLI